MNHADAEVLCRPRDGDRLLVDVADMRARMAKELTKDGDAWDVKHMRGGMVDVEFVSQYLQLRHAPTHPHILSPNTETALRNLAAAGLLPAADAEALDRAHFLWLTVQGVLRHCIDGRFSEDTAPPGLKDKLVKAAGCDSFEHLQQAMAARAAAASDVFRRVVDEPAAAARARLAEVQADAGGVEGDRS